MAVVTPRSAAARRLTPTQLADRALTEIDFQRMIVGTKPKGLAVIFGWEHIHFRPAMTKHGMRTPGSGSMAQGWPDLVLVRASDRRVIFAELKRELTHPSPDQERVLAVLRALACHWSGSCTPGFADGDHPHVSVHVWRPSDLTSGAIEAVLR